MFSNNIISSQKRFNKKMPLDYYSTKIINSFTNYDKSKTNFNTKIYKRNPEVLGRLTLNHIETIEFFVRLLKPKNFLELGVQYGECTNQILNLIPDKYIGVDIKKTENIDYLLDTYKNFEFYECTTDDFFKNEKQTKFDMVFIDACHSHEATYKDFLNVKDLLNEDGFIFFHDCYPYSEYWTKPTLCGDGYKTSEVIRKKHNNEFEILTLPVNPGLSIARKCTKQLAWLN